MKKYKFVTCCVNAIGEDINEMRNHPKNIQVTYRTMRKHCGDSLKEITTQIGYDKYLPIHKDWHVSYHRSVYQDKPCYYFVWSAIEHIFQ